MKANELMIGDWVEYRFTGWTEKGGVYKDYQYVQISSIGQLYIKADNDRVASADGEEFYPIPITPEILEKNFEKKIFYGMYDDFFDLEIREYYEGVYAVTYHYCEFPQKDQIVLVSFIHELQHTLRLLNIEKEIVL